MQQPLGSARRLRVIVIGAGIVGASIAYHLSRRGCTVIVLERHRPGQGASGHSFAWLNSFEKHPASYHDLNRRSMDMWHRFAHDLGMEIGLHWGGELRWVHTPVKAAELQQRIAQLQEWGYPNRLIDADELLQLEPALSPGPVAAASFGPIDGQVEPPLVVEACLQRAQSARTKVYTETTVTGLHLSRNGHSTPRLLEVQTSQGALPCDAAVLAAGTATTALAAMAGVHIPQQESPGVVIRTNRRPRLLQTVSVLHTPPIDAQRPEIHLRQCSNGTLMIGEGSQESLNRDDSQAHADALLARAIHYLPTLAGARAIPVPVGYRPMPIDGLPVLGFTAAVPNLYLALMHSGVTLAPLVGAWATLEIVDGARLAHLASYRPERFH